MKKCVLYSTNRTFPGAPKPSPGCAAPGRRARGRRRDGAIWQSSAADWLRSRGTSTRRGAPDRCTSVARLWSSFIGLIHCCALDRVVRCAGVLAGGVLDCNLAHRRSVSELSMLFKIKSNPMHDLSCVFPLPYVPTRVSS